jgi:hypothetical protein
MLYAFDYTQKQIQKVAQPWPLPINKSNGLELLRQTTENDGHNEEKCQLVEVEKKFKKPLDFFVKIVNICPNILEKTIGLSIKTNPHICILQGK